MQLSSRPAIHADFEAFFIGLKDTYGYGEEARERLAHEWRMLRKNPSTISLIIEDSSRVAEERCVAYAQAVFVTEALVHRLTTNMPPCVNLHLETELPDGGPAILPPADVTVANSGPGLNVLFTHWGWYESRLTEEEAVRVREFLLRSFLTSYRGFKLKELFLEVFGEMARQMTLNAGFRQRSDYEDYFQSNDAPPADLRPYLMGVSRQEAISCEGSLVSQAFVYSRPRFFFRPHEQEMLCQAIRGIPDEEIANALCITVPAVKKRWISIYDRVSEACSDLLPPTPEGSRGAEKRRVLIQYLHDHQEELRPVQAPPRLDKNGRERLEPDRKSPTNGARHTRPT